MAATDEELEKQAEEMAKKALPASLPESVRSAKLPAVKQKILDRLKAQRTERAANAQAVVPVHKPAAVVGAAAPQANSANPPPPGAAPPPPPPPGEAVEKVSRIEGVELCGDELWFADSTVRRMLRESCADAHKEQKILVAPAEEEVERICPSEGFTLGAGGVLRLGGSRVGGYGENDVAYAYRQLSRALHPDKNPDLPKAPAAFHRLSEAADELRQGLNDQRSALQMIVAAMGGQATPEMLARPQEALFAEACRILLAVCGIAGEGQVSAVAQTRAATAFTRTRVFHTCQFQSLLSDWFDRASLLELFAGPGMRTAYDCAPKRCRAQLLCLLNRAVICEAKRCHGCVRGAWSQIMQTFPELGIWREFREMLQGRVWDCSRDPPYVPKPERSRSRKKSRSRDRKRRREEEEAEKEKEKRRRSDSVQDPEGKEKDRKWDSRWRSTDDNPGQAAPAVEKEDKKKSDREATRECREAIARNPQTGALASRWARKWRTAMATVMPSASAGGASQTDEELRNLGAALWKDVLQALPKSAAVERALGLLRADPQTKSEGSEAPAPPRGLPADTPPAEWAFLPLADLLLVVGEGLVGSTVEGFLVEKPVKHGRKPFAACYKKAGEAKKNSRRGDDRKRDHGESRTGDRGGGGPSKWDKQQ